MSSSKGKKVHYERGTKGEKSHRHHNSRDSGVGSSSASDRASLDQRKSVTALQEALDAANDKVRQLEAANARLSASLAESNKEVRSLKKERLDLLKKNDELVDDLEDERRLNERLRREGSPRTGGAALSPRTERRSTPPRREHTDPRPHHREDERSQGSYSERRTSYIPTVPQTPPPQNPFTPISPISTRAPSVSYGSAVTYAPAPVTYTSSPIYNSPPPSTTSSRFAPNDGKYHPYPV